MIPDAPSLADLRRSAEVFNGYSGVDESWLRFRQVTRPAVDLSRSDHREALLRWLNSWGCRIRYPRVGEPALFDEGIAAWWAGPGRALPAGSLAGLSDVDIDAVAAAYGALATVPVAAGRASRTLGPTAAAKALYAVRPRAVPPWDAAIAARQYGGRDATAFARHLRASRDWAWAVLAEAGPAATEDDLPALIGRPSVSMAKIIDEHLYVTITLAARQAARASQRDGS